MCEAGITLIFSTSTTDYTLSHERMLVAISRAEISI